MRGLFKGLAAGASCVACDERNPDKQMEFLQRIRDDLESQVVGFIWDLFDTIHACPPM